MNHLNTILTAAISDGTTTFKHMFEHYTIPFSSKKFEPQIIELLKVTKYDLDELETLMYATLLEQVATGGKTIGFYINRGAIIHKVMNNIKINKHYYDEVESAKYCQHM